MIHVRHIAAFEDNYIWLAAADPQRVVIIDPGDADPVAERVSHDGLEPAAILVTHHHNDHTGGVAELAARYRVPVYGPPGGRIPALTDPVREGDVVHVGALAFTVLDTPGHTRDHVCYLAEDALFCGDTLFTAGCGRLFEGTAQQMYASLARIAALPPATRIFCAHEYTLDNLRFAVVAEPDNPAITRRHDEARLLRAAGQPTVPSTLALELATNPFLRCHEPQLAAAAAAQAGRELRSGGEILGAIRSWKDRFDRGG